MTDDPTDRPRHRRPWNDADDRELRRLIEAREPPARIARSLQRTQDAIRGRAAQLGLALPSALRPWRRHWRNKATGQPRDPDPQQTESGDPASEGGDE